MAMRSCIDIEETSDLGWVKRAWNWLGPTQRSATGGFHPPITRLYLDVSEPPRSELSLTRPYPPDATECLSNPPDAAERLSIPPDATERLSNPPVPVSDGLDQR